MSFTKKLLALLVVLAMSLTVLCSCDNGEGDSTTTPEATTTQPSDITDDTTLPDDPGFVGMDPEAIQIRVEEGAVNFKVIRPDAISDVNHPVISAAKLVSTNIGSIIGKDATLDNDFIKKGQEHKSETLEILVGNTTYNETASVASKCGYGDYAVEVVGNKIVIFAYSDEGILKAATHFVKMITQGKGTDEDGKDVINLKASVINMKETLEPQLSHLPVFEGGTYYAYYDSGTRTGNENTSCDEIIYKNATPELLSAYIAKVEASGYTKISENEIEGNSFAVFNNDAYTVTAGYYKHDKTVRLLIEPKIPDLPAKKTDYQKVTSTQITMLGLEYGSAGNYTSNGLSILIRLDDGRFIVVDGGFNRAGTANHFFNTIKSQASAYTTKPVVAAWIITHAHGDHQGMLNGYYSQFKAKGITVESIIHSFMSDAERAKSANSSENFGATEGGGATTTYAAAIALGATVYKAHVGQTYYFANMKMDVFYTHESYAPTTIHALNVSSNVFKMTFDTDGKTTTYLCTGDATGHGMKISAKMFGQYMQCDIVQVCHHGYTTWGDDGGMITGYNTTNATLVLWPQGLNAYSRYVDKSYNSALFKTSNYKECWVAGAEGDLVVVPLPYVFGETEIQHTCVKNCLVPHHYTKAG